MFKQLFLAAAISASSFTAATVQAAPVNVDLVFVIDDSGSMSDEGATLAARIGEVMAGIAADPRIGTVSAGIVKYLASATVVQAVTTVVADLQTAINSLQYFGATENGLSAMTSLLPGGSNFGAIGWTPGTVRSFVLLTDEPSNPGNDYNAFAALLDSEGYLNNVIVSDFGTRCAEFQVGGSTDGGCEYISSSRPAGGDAAFDLIDFTTNTDDFILGFVDTKIREIVITNPVGSVPLPAAGWLLIAGLGGLGAMRRRKGKASA